MTGTAMVGGSLSILHRGEFVFWWQRAETSGVQDDGKELKFEDIPGADSDTYTCQLEDANTVLRVVYQRPGVRAERLWLPLRPYPIRMISADIDRPATTITQPFLPPLPSSFS